MRKPSVRARIGWIGFGISVLFCCLVFKLAVVQLKQGDWIRHQAEDSWKRDVPMMAKRGRILDRNGEALTYDVSRPTVLAVPVQVTSPQAEAAALANVLGGSAGEIQKMLKRKQLVVRIQPNGRRITLEQAEQIRKLNLPGIVVAEDSKRYYPFGQLAAHVLGFTGIDHQGLTGLEKKYDQQLQGINGSLSFYADAAGRNIPTLPNTHQKSYDGLELQLTIDRYIQSTLERELELTMATTQAEKALGIVMNPRNGEILAMASRPAFEPDRFRDYPQELLNRNLPVWMTYEPGSTFKIVTLAAALEEKVIDLKKDHFHDPGFIEVNGARLRCWKRSGHGSETFLEVVQNSCNPGFVTMGQKLGKETLLTYIRKFGFGQRTKIDLAGEANGILFKPTQMGPVELATTSFGQGVSVTPIQQIAAVASAINGGTYFKPYVAKAWKDPITNRTVSETKPKAVRQVISKETSAQVRDALEHVVALGTGRNAFIPGYRVAGKTGTAQKVVDGKYSDQAYIVSFIGFAPADDPEVIMYVAIDHPKGIQFGGVVAAPVVQKVFQDILPYMKVPVRQNEIKKEYRYGDPIYAAIPDWRGMRYKEILQNSDAMIDFRVETIGTGPVVVHQQPMPGASVLSGTTVRLFMGEPNQLKE